LDPNGNYYPSSTTTTMLTRTTPAGVTYNSTVTKLVTPQVVNFTRAHYNCSTMYGAELEDAGGAGTAGSHWEARVPTFLGIFSYFS
jgi:hypothetical protein